MTDKTNNETPKTPELDEKQREEQRLKAEKERLAQLKQRREADMFKRKYFEYYDDIKTNYREDW